MLRSSCPCYCKKTRVVALFFDDIFNVRVIADVKHYRTNALF